MFGAGGGAGFAARAEHVSEAAVEEDPTSALASLDLGLSRWAISRWALSEDDFFLKVQGAEASLVKSHDMGLPLATLCLARLYRQTYRPAQALDWFSEFARRDERRRVVLAESHLVGESTVLLLHRDIDPLFLKDRLLKSERLLSEAVQAGYKNARLLVSLARIRFALGDEVGGLGFLQEIVRGNCTNWTLAVEKAREAIQANDLDLLHSAFALGMNDGLVWNSLGTFAKAGHARFRLCDSIV
jgi:tetratricopeptide (TPR) repeat protein